MDGETPVVFFFNGNETTVMQNQIANCIKMVAKEVLGESKENKHFDKET